MASVRPPKRKTPGDVAALPEGAIGICFYCKKFVPRGSPWQLRIVWGASELFHRFCPTPKS